MNTKNVLKEAEEIIFHQSQEKERDYGPIDESMQKMADIASILTGKKLTTEDMYKCMMALKMSRLSRSYKRDNYLDLVAYAGALDDYLSRKESTTATNEMMEKISEKIRKIEALKYNDKDRF